MNLDLIAKAVVFTKALPVSCPLLHDLIHSQAR